MDAATLVVVFLLVTAASLASYLFSQWSSIRNSNIGIGWVVTSIGITLLLGAAAMVVLTVGLLPTLRPLPNIESAERMRKPAQLGRGTAERVVDRQEAPTQALSTPSVRGASPAAVRYTAEGHAENRRGPSVASSLQPSGSPREPKSEAAADGVGVAFTGADPWAATNCVLAFNPDPADLTRWTIENWCGSPVAVVFASCSKSPPQCSDRLATLWEYQLDGMILPGRAQRPVTYEEETRYGSQIRYVACMVATPVAIKLIRQSSEFRSSPSWSEQFNAARNGDECLMSVQKWSDLGRSSGQPIDVLLNVNVPGKVRPDSTANVRERLSSRI